MGIDIKITNKLDNNCVQVEVNSNKGGQSKYFKVPVDKADSFITNYKKMIKHILHYKHCICFVYFRRCTSF